MNRTLKKIVCLILTVIMTVSAVPLCFAANEEYPTVYITGAQTNEIVAADGSTLYPLDDDLDAMQIIKDALAPCLEKLVIGFITGNYEDYAQEFYNVFVPIFEDMALDKNGEASDGSHSRVNINNCEILKKTGGYNEWDYHFGYDWRISPMIAADELKIYIDMVKEATGEDKVNLMGRCYGANVIAAYLAKYEEHALSNVDDIAYMSSSVLGIDMLAALFSGEMKFEDQAIENFVNYFMEEENLIEDETTKLFVLTLVELFNQVKVLGLTGEGIELLVNEVKKDLIPLILRDTYGSMPSYWSMVTPELYEKAIDFVFGDCKEEYAKLIEKTDDFHYNVQLGAEEKMRSLAEKGIDFHIFVKYNFPDFPIYDGATALGDGYTTCVRQGFGGEYADYGTVFSDKYIASLENKTYLSPDLKINASTCLFPETTWFIKDMEHETFPYAINRFALDVMNGELTVSSGVKPQFSTFDGKVCTETVGTDEDATKAPDTPLVSLMRFLTAFFNLITKIINGELSFDGLFGDK